MSQDGDRAARRAARASWPGRRTTLADQMPGGVVLHLPPSKRMDAVWEITLDLWASTGRPWPTYSRDEMPGRLIRLEDDV